MPEQRPNLLLLFPDQWRWDWLGCHESGVPVRTPTIDALAARGVRFDRCRSNSPVCSPARACLSTGMRYESCGVPDNKAVCDPNRTTIWQRLRHAGYRVATCGKNDLDKPGHRFHRSGWSPALGSLGFTDVREHAGKWDWLANHRKGHPESFRAYLAEHGMLDTYIADMQRRREIRNNEQRIDHTPFDLPRRFYTDDFCGQNALRLIDDLPDDAPWALWVNFPGPHEPFDPPQELADRYHNVDFPPPIEAGESPNNHQQLRRNYAAMCEGIDEWCGWILNAIHRRGELDNTLVVFASDHGELLGDHGRWSKARPEEGSVRVPCVVAGPGVEAKGRNDALVELIDIGATLLDAAQIPIPETMEARSLLPACRGEPHRDVQLMALGDWRAICDDRYKYISWQDGRECLFDLSEDPDERTNLMTSLTAEAQGLRERLDQETRPMVTGRP